MRDHYHLLPGVVLYLICLEVLVLGLEGVLRQAGCRFDVIYAEPFAVDEPRNKAVVSQPVHGGGGVRFDPVGPQLLHPLSRPTE